MSTSTETQKSSSENIPAHQEEDKPGSSGTSSSPAEESKNDDKLRFECNICLECAQDAVVTRCGHLYCWPCLHTWLETRRDNPLCPVCKSVVDKDNVTPIYGKFSENVDPRTKTQVPPRPTGQRTEDPTGGNSENAFGFPWNYQPNGGVHANVHFSFGFGVFPFSFVASFLNGNGVNVDQNGGDPDEVRAHNDLISNVFLGLGIGFILWLLLT